MLRDVIETNSLSTAVESEFVSMTSLNTWVYEKDIGNMCCYLISDDSSRISGQVVGVDGNTLRMH